MAPSRTRVVNGLTFRIANCTNECGLTVDSCDTAIQIPFFELGFPGVLDYVAFIVVIPVPPKMNPEWFFNFARFLQGYANHDYDWESFKTNCLELNKSHLKTELDLNDYYVNEFLLFGHVFLDNAHGSWEDEGEDTQEMESMNAYYPSLENFLAKKNLEF
jgi:hypothetical protein